MQVIHTPIYRFAYLLGGVVALAGAAATFAIDRNIGQTPSRRLLWKREYRLYYLLAFLEGCRKQIFLTLAVLVLVKIHNTPVHHIAAMMILYNFANWFGSPVVGRMIDRFGQRPIMTINYAGVMLVFIGYSLFRQWPVLYLLYCMDNLFNVFNIALTTYLKRIALPEDIAPSLAMGMTANHLASVIVPLIACFVWEHVDYRIPFVFGSLVALCSLISAQWVGELER
jgi:MFS family permease